MTADLLARLFVRAEWMDDAACRGMDPNLFFPGTGRVANAALEVCAGCTVTAQCRQYAIDNGERAGVWGGLNPTRVDRLRNGRSRGYRSPTNASRCGTPSGYNAHRNRGEQACPDCRAAKAAAKADSRRRERRAS